MPYEEIWADSGGAAFGGRLRRVGRLQRTCTSTAAVRARRSAAGATDAIAGRQSIQSQYPAATELHASKTFNTKRTIFNAKHRCKRSPHAWA